MSYLVSGLGQSQHFPESKVEFPMSRWNRYGAIGALPVPTALINIMPGAFAEAVASGLQTSEGDITPKGAAAVAAAAVEEQSFAAKAKKAAPYVAGAVVAALVVRKLLK